MSTTGPFPNHDIENNEICTPSNERAITVSVGESNKILHQKDFIETGEMASSASIACKFCKGHYEQRTLQVSEIFAGVLLKNHPSAEIRDSRSCSLTFVVATKFALELRKIYVVIMKLLLVGAFFAILSSVHGNSSYVKKTPVSAQN